MPQNNMLERIMMGLKNIHLCKSRYIDGELEDGRLVEFKANVPRKFDDLIRHIVGIANTTGGFIIFGINQRALTAKGVVGDYQNFIGNLELSIKKLSVGISYNIIHEEIENRNVVILEIIKAYTTAYFSRVETTPARQIAYISGGQDRNSISKEKMTYTRVFKYMTLEAFLVSLYSKTWRFFEPSKWNDKFEQRFYCANYEIPTAEENTPQLFATCLTKCQNSDAAWKVYSNGQGLNAHCLQLELDIVELRKQLRASEYHFEERIIDYKPESVILNLHNKKGKYYKKYFTPFTIDSFFNLLSLKRNAYTYEQELRLFIIPTKGGKRNKHKKAQHIDLNINWSKVITKVRIDKKCSDAELVSIQKACISVGINPVIKNYTFIGKTSLPNGLKKVEFIRYNIDDMPGTNGITIS